MGGGGGGHEKPIYRGDCLKRGPWTICRFKGGPWQERGAGGGVFEGEGGVDAPMQTMNILSTKINKTVWSRDIWILIHFELKM